MIKQIEVSSYRLLHEFTADFGDLTVIIGANATGKSTLLDCLRSLGNLATFPLETVFTGNNAIPALLNASADDKTLRWKATLTKPTSSRWHEIPVHEYHDYVYEIKLEVDRLGYIVPQYECLRNAKPSKGHETPFKLLEATDKRSSLYDFKQKKLVPFDDAITSNDTHANSSVPTSGRLDDIAQLQEEGKLLRLARMRFVNEFPQPSWWRFFLSRMAFYPGFEVGPTSFIRTKASEIKPLTTLDMQGENLATVLHEILTRSSYSECATDLIRFVKLAYPFVEGIFAETTPTSPPQVLATIRERGQTRQLQLGELSDGMIRFICLSVALLNPIAPTVVFLDEPEAGLHPKLLPLVADMIKMASEDRQIIVTTHSPELLDQFDIDNVAVMSRDGNRARWSRPGSRESLRQMLDSVSGETLGDLHRNGELEAMG